VDELEELIRSQASDIRAGDFQPSEPGTVHYMGHLGDTPLEDFIEMTRTRKTRDYPECAYHGRGHLVSEPGSFSGFRCRRCNTEASIRHKKTAKGRATQRAANKRWAAANPEKTQEYNRAAYRRMREDPVKWAKHKARAAERRRRYRSASKEAGNE
jgi:hypothetical protein